MVEDTGMVFVSPGVVMVRVVPLSLASVDVVVSLSLSTEALLFCSPLAASTEVELQDRGMESGRASGDADGNILKY